MANCKVEVKERICHYGLKADFLTFLTCPEKNSRASVFSLASAHLCHVSNRSQRQKAEFDPFQASSRKNACHGKTSEKSVLKLAPTHNLSPMHSPEAYWDQAH